MKRSKICPLCNKNDTKIFLSKNINEQNINKYTFSSRKVPEFMNYELLRCNGCTFVYAVNIPEQNYVKHNYANSVFVSNEDAYDAANTYFQNIKRNIKFINYENAIEIGAGSGSFLEKLKVLGFKNIIGIEPSISSIKNAKDEIKKNLINDIFEKANINDDSNDLVCCFMTMEHVYDPIMTIKKSYDILRNKGKIILVTHDCDHILHRILGKKSPIIDIEHLQLFSSKSIKKILEKNNFKNVRILKLKNSYNLSYWVSLFPLPFFIKNIIQKISKLVRLSNLKIRLNVGNIMICADKC
jgi:2-polyprenyl-3-methyl-5-hydroxy-6-metoxy-1,4-benzoquinol methylase